MLAWTGCLKWQETVIYFYFLFVIRIGAFQFVVSKLELSVKIARCSEHRYKDKR